METRLVATLVDKISGPAHKMQSALKGVANATNQKVGGVFSSINRELGYTNRKLDQVRGQMVDAVAQVYILKNALASPVKAAAEFESKLTDIGQIAGKSREEMAAFGRELIKMSPQATKSAGELAEAMQALVGKNLNFDIAKKALPTIAQVSSAYTADMTDIANTTMAVIDNLQVKIEQLPEALDRLSAAGKAGAFELKDMAKSLPEITALAQMRGLTGIKGLTELGAALQIVRKGSGDASEAATNLKNVLQKLDSETTKNKFGEIMSERDKAAKKLTLPQIPASLKKAFAAGFPGWKAKDIKSANKEIDDLYKKHWLLNQLYEREQKGMSRLQAIIDVTRSTLGSAEIEKRAADLAAAGKSPEEIAKELATMKFKSGLSLGDLFQDLQAQTGMASLVSNTKLLQQYIEQINKEHAGMGLDDLGRRSKDLAFKIEQLNNRWESFKIVVGGSLGPALIPAMDALGTLTTRIGELAEKYPELIRYTALGATALIGFKIAVTGVSWAFLSLKVAALTTLAVLGGWLAPLAALAAGVYLLYQRWDQVKALMPTVAKAFESAINWMKNNWSELPGKVWEVAVAIKDKLLNTDWMQVGRDMISSLWAGMKEWLNKILAGVGDFVGKVKGLFVGSASASTGGSATSMSGATGGGGGGGGYTAAAERMRRLSGGGASGATPSSGRGGGATPSTSGGATPNIAGRGGTLDRMLAGSGGGFNVRGVKNMNPGNIAYGPWARAHGAIGAAGRDTGHGVAVFPSFAAGAAALESLAAAKYAGGKRSIDALIAGKGGWTPGNHAAAANVARMMGISPHADARLSDKAMMRKFRNALMVQELGPGGARHTLAKLAGRARGGPVHAGQSYVVGEQGWEIFKPRQSGQIVNQKQLAAEGRNAQGGSMVHFAPTINVHGGGNPVETVTMVRRVMREEVRSLFRGSHSDVGFAAT